MRVAVFFEHRGWLLHDVVGRLVPQILIYLVSFNGGQHRPAAGRNGWWRPAAASLLAKVELEALRSHIGFADREIGSNLFALVFLGSGAFPP